MKLLTCAAAFLLSAFMAIGAQFKISDLQETNTTGGGTVWIELDQGGVKSWKINSENLAKAIGTNGNIVIMSITTNLVNVSYVTNLTVIQTNVANYTITTNLITYQTNIANYIITTNLITYETNINNVTITTNLYVYETNIVNQTITTNLTVYQTNISNWIISTNVITYETNYVNYSYTTNLTVNNIANVKTMYVTNITVVNSLDVPTDGHFGTITVTNNSYFLGPALSYSSSASNAPAANELPTAQWVRSLFNNGLILYVSTNIYTDATNVDEPHVVYQYTNQIPPTASRYYPTVNANDYIGSVVPTNRFTTLQGPVLVKAFLQRTNGLGSPTVSVRAELYWSTNRTNWQGDFAANDQVISTGTNIYEWVISLPIISNTNGFWIQRRFKVVTATGATHPDVVVHIGTNYLSGTNDAAHIALAGTASGSGGGSGATTVIITNVGVLGTNIAYTTNQAIDFSTLYNDYQQTNACANHINVWATNLVQGASISLSIQGATTYTNYSVFFYWPPYATVTWLSLTNGTPVTTITSNKVQFYSFLVRTNHTQTNVIASFKEQP